MNNQGSKYACRVLGAIVRMVEGRSVCIGLKDVGNVASGRHRTLGGGRHAIVPRCANLADAVKVKSCTFLGTLYLVDQRDLDHVSPVGLDGWTGELAVDDDHGPIHSIRSKVRARDCEFVPTCHTGLRYGAVAAGSGVLCAGVRC